MAVTLSQFNSQKSIAQHSTAERILADTKRMKMRISVTTSPCFLFNCTKLDLYWTALVQYWWQQKKSQGDEDTREQRWDELTEAKWKRRGGRAEEPHNMVRKSAALAVHSSHDCHGRWLVR